MKAPISSRFTKMRVVFASTDRVIYFTLIALCALGGILITFRMVAKTEKVCGSEALQERPSNSTGAKGVVTLRDRERHKPYTNLQDGHAMSMQYVGNQRSRAALASGAESRALATADLDADGAPDLIAGYAANGLGIVTVQRGNIDAYAPKDDAVFLRIQQGFNPDSVLPGAETFEVPESADYIATGDFNADGLKDVAIGAHLGGLYLLAGDGKAGLSAPVRINVGGPVTALAAGRLTANGQTQLAVGIAGRNALEIYGGSLGELTNIATYDLVGEPAAIEFGQLDDDPFGDLAVAAGHQLTIVHGWFGEAPPENRAERLGLPFGAEGLAIGNFVWDREARVEMAVLGDDGNLRVLEQGAIDKRPYNEDELRLRRGARGNSKGKANLNPDLQFVPRWEPGKGKGWNVPRAFGTNRAITAGVVSQARLVHSNIARQDTEEVIVVDGAQKTVNLVRQHKTPEASNVAPSEPELDDARQKVSAVRQHHARAANQRALARSEQYYFTTDSLEISEAPAAVMGMPAKVNGSSDLVFLAATQPAPSIVPLAATSITVDTTVDNPALSACTGAAGDCSLRGAVAFANIAANSPATINIPAGTYSLTIPAGPIEFGGTNICSHPEAGDLDIDLDTTLMGASAATTIIQQTQTQDRVLCLNPHVIAGRQYTITGVTVTGGREPSKYGGAGLVGGARNDSTTISSSIFTDNQAWDSGACPGCTGYGSGGGAIKIEGGTLNITNCTIGTDNLPSSFGSAVNITKSNAGGSGGGVNYSPGAPLGCAVATPCTGDLNLSGSTIKTNTAFSAASGGGGLDLYQHNLGTGSFIIGTTTITGNQATAGTGGGGGIIVEAGPLTINNGVSITNNSAGGTGGGLNLTAGSVALTTSGGGTITFQGNTSGAGTFGSGIRANGNVTVTGTGLTVINDVDVQDLCTWTNNAGSAVAITNLRLVDISGGGSVGTYTANNSTTNLTGNLTVAGGLYSANTGTANIGGNQSITSGTFNNGTTTNLTGNFSLSGGTFNGSSGAVNVTGNFTFSGGAFNANTSTFTFNSAGAQSINGPSSPTFNNLTKSGAGTTTLFVDTPIAGNLNVSAGILDLSNFTANRTAAGGTLTVANGTTLKIGGTGTVPSNFNTHSIGATSTIEYSGTNQSVVVLNSSQNYGNLTTSGSGTKTLAGPISVASAVTIGSGTVLAAGANALNVAGNWTNNAGNTGFTSTGTVTLNGSGVVQTISGNTNFFNLTLNNSSSSTQFGASTTTAIQNNLVTSAGSMLAATDSTVIFTGAAGSISGANPKQFYNLQINVGATISNSTGGNTTILNDYTNNGTYTQAAGLTTTFATSLVDGIHNFSGSGTTTFGVVTINGSNTVNAGSHNFIVAGASFNSNGNFNGDTGTVTFNGPAAQAIAGTGTKNFNGLTINNANGVSVTDVAGTVDATVGGVLTLTTDLTVASGAILQQSGTSMGARDVIGTVRRTDLGSPNGTARPFGNANNTITINSGTAPNPMDVALVKLAPVGFPAGTAVVPRTYTLTPTGGSGISATLKLRYIDPAELGGITESKLLLWKNIAGTWKAQGGTLDSVNNFVSLSGVTGFSDWAIAEGSDLTVSKSNNVSNSAVVGQTWTWTLTVNNAGGAPADFTSGQTILTDTLPNSSNISYGSPLVSDPNVSCVIDGSKDLTCTAGGSGATIAEAGSFTVQFTAVAAAIGTYQNPRSGGNTQVDPTGLIPESNESNNTAANNTVTVGQAATTTTITNAASLTANPSVTGQPVTVQWSVTVNSPGSLGAAFTGNVTVTAGADSCNAPVATGQCDITFTTPGSKSITASFPGDSNYITSTSSPATAHTVISPPTIVKSFVPASTPLGSTPTMRFVVTNPNSSTTLTGIAFNDTTPQGITVGTNGPTVICGGSLQTTAGHTVAFSGGTLGGGASCTIDVGVGAVEAGDWQNTTGVISSTQTGPGATSNQATLTVVAPPVIAKTFNPTNTLPGGSSTLTFTITNPVENTVGLTGVAFTDNLPAGIKVAGTPNVQPAVSPCGGAVTAVANSGQISLSGGSIVVGGMCTISVDVTATTGGLNQVQVTSTNGGTGNTASATLTTCNAPPLGMTNWWTGDDTARDIAGGKDGMLNGLDTFPDVEYSAGKVLNGFDFDGINDLVNVGDVDLPSTFTIDAWVNPTNLSIDRAIVSKDDGATQRSYYFHITSAGALQASVNSAGGFTVYQTADGVITAGSLQHVAVTYDGAAGAGAKMLFYKNGALVASTVQGGQDAGGTPENNSLAALIGRSATTNNTFLGVIDEVEFFSRVLSVGEVNSIFTADSGGKCKPSDLKVTKTHSGNFNQGSTGNNYTITVHNDGPGTTSGTTTVTDQLPAGLTATAMSGTGWTCTPLGGGIAGPTTLTCTSTDAIASGANFPAITLTVSVGVNTPSASNQVTVSGGGEMDTSDDTASDPTTLSPVADLAVTKSDSPDPVTAGNNITYTINFINNGPSSALGVSVTDAVPANTTFVSAGVTLGSGWGQVDPGVGNTGNVVFSRATVANGETATFQVVVKVNPGTLAATITNSAVAAASGSADPTSGNDTANASTTVNTLADLAVTKSDSPDPVNAGANLTYTINFVNNGPSNAQTVSVTDAVPANTTFVSASVTTGAGWGVVDPGVGNTGNLVFSKATVAPGETAQFTMVVNVNAATADNATITNSATAASSTTDSDSSNNTGTATTTVINQADLSVTKSDAPDPITAGNNITYTINFQNSGPGSAVTTTVTDAVPANTTFVSASVTTGSGWGVVDPGVGNTGNVVFSKGSVANGETAVFQVVVKVNANTASGATITNSATAAATTVDPDSSNNTGTATTTVATEADLLVTKTDSPDPAVAGTNLTYSVTITNNGTSDAQGVSLTDAVPANTTFVSVSQNTGPAFTITQPPAGGTGNVSCTLATLAAGASANFSMVVKIDAGVANGTTITNSAVGATTTTDPNSSNNTATATTTVATSADLAVTKGDAPDPVTAGNNLNYTINFVNNGPSAASTVTVTDAVPANTTFVSAVVTTGTGWSITDPGVGNTGNVVFSKGTVALGETAVFTMVVKVNASAAAGSTISNTATAAGTSADPNNGNDSATATTTVNRSADLAVTKGDAPDPVVADANLTYTLNFVNNGPSDASTVTVTDAVPANTTFFSASVTTGAGWSISAPGVGGTGNVVFSKGTVAAGETAVFQVVVKVNASAVDGSTISNSATAATTTTDPDNSNNTGTATTTVTNKADVSITKSDAPDPVVVGTNITYTLNFANNGPATANTVTVTDAVPVNTTFFAAIVTTGSGWSISAPAVGGTGNVIFSRASVPSGETAVFTIVVNVNPGTPHNTVITNTAVAGNTTVDPDSSNNTAVTTTTVTSTLALTVNDSGDAADNNVGDRICDTNAAPGDQCTLRAAIQETNAAVTNDTIDFSLPANTTIVLLSALPDINGGHLVMTGPASGVTVSGNNLYRVFNVVSGNVQLLNLTIANGQASQGGGIFNSGNLTITNSTLTGNKAVGSEGGGIYSNNGTLTIINSTISGNTSDGVGGGLANAGTSTATLVNVTVTNNRADADGNASGNGGGISQTSSNPITLRNTIVAGNFVGLSPGTVADDINGTVDPAGNNNLIGTGGAGGLTNGVNNNQVGVVDARLGVLASNGGPTQTHALLSGSVALDAGDDSVTGGPYNLTTDQRGPGFPRKTDGPDANTTQTVDIGAFEADPSVEDISDKSTNEDTALPTFVFNVGDAATPFTSIVATSSNQTLVPDANLVVGPNTPSTRTLSITPAPNQFGTATITVTATKVIGGNPVSFSDTFILTVNGVNDPPSFTKGPDQTVAEDSGAQSVANWATAISQGPGNESGQTLTFLVQNNTNPGLFSAGPAISPTGTLTYTPAADANGTATITIALMDNGGGTDTSASQSFQITITEVNDAPDAVDDALSSVAEDSGPRTISIASLLANDSKGPANESGQTLTLTAVSNPVGGTVTKDAVNVYFTPTADFNGPASFQYSITDNGTTNGAAGPKQDTATVSFTVTEVNDAPTAVSETIPNLTEDSPQSIPFATLTANDVKGPANESGQTLTVKTVGNPVGGTVSINILAGNVVFTPAANYTGPGSFDYTVEDNGTTNGVADPKTSGVATASFTITSVNDAPVAVNDTLTSMAEDAAPRAIPFADLTANDSKGGPDESGQTLTVVSVGNAVGGTVLLVPGFVVFTPNGDYNGPASFTYTVQDNGTTNGAPDPKTSGSALVQFTITEVNDAPSAFNDTLPDVAQNSGERTIAFADLLANDLKGPADESGQTLTILSVGNPVGVTVSIVAGTVRVTPLPDFAGPAGFQYTMRDNGTTSGFGDEKTSVATVSFNVIGQGGGGGVLRFSAANYSVAEGAGFRTITVERTGDSSQAVTVDYASSDHSNPADFIPCSSPGVGFASSRCDFTTALGTLRFAAGETSKTFNVLISNDNYVEGPETLELTLSNPTGGAVFGVPQTAVLTIQDDLSEPGTNPIDTSSEFVRSQYHDFLNREPDAPGLAFWTDNIELCNDASRRPVGQTVAQCIDKQRESTAVAFFAAPEFQITGGFVYNLYKGSLTGAPNYDGGSPGASPGRFPTSLEFMRDVGQVSEGIVVNNAISGAVVEANRNRLAAEFVQRPEFIIKYGGLNNTLYVDELFNTTGITPTAAEKQALVDGLTGGTETRASVLRKVVDGTVVISESDVQFTTSYGQAFINQENRRKFVFMEYIAYLRRNPDTPGFVFWLGKLNFYNGDPFQAEMVRSFILSPEYRNRFGQP